MKADLTHQYIARRLLEEVDLDDVERKFCQGMARCVYLTEGQEDWRGKLAERLGDEMADKS